MALSMKDSIHKARNMDSENYFFQTEALTKEILLIMIFMVEEYTDGKRVKNTRVIG